MTEATDRWLNELKARIRHLRHLTDRLHRLRTELTRPETHPQVLKKRHTEVADLLQTAAAWDWTEGWQTLQAYLRGLQESLPERWLPWRHRWFQQLNESLGPLV
ncbi:MAG: hypothetical protein NZ742_12765, partial [Acidobacteria bacterium]|nr:hypothetical protein [Acidobacteriota bacterium]MDW7985541.1 hypothetical protein [Acidobacteriota bacterium]